MSQILNVDALGNHLICMFHKNHHLATRAWEKHLCWRANVWTWLANSNTHKCSI